METDDLLEYLKTLNWWGYKKEAFEKLCIVAEHIEDSDELQTIYYDWKFNDETYSWFGYPYR